MDEKFSRTGYLPKIRSEKYNVIKIQQLNTLKDKQYYVATYGDYGKFLKKKNDKHYFLRKTGVT